MDLVKLIHGFVKVVLCILHFAKQIQAEVWSSFQCLTKDVEWVNVLDMPWVQCAFGNVSYSICSCFSLDCCICPWLSVKLYKKISFPDGWARNIFPKYWFSDIIENIEHSCKKRWNLLLLGKFLQPDNWTTQSRKGWSFEQNWHCMCSSSCNSLMGSHSIYPPNLLRSP